MDQIIELFRQDIGFALAKIGMVIIILLVVFILTRIKQVQFLLMWVITTLIILGMMVLVLILNLRSAYWKARS